MKLNLKKMELNQAILIIAITAVVIWMIVRYKGRIEYNEGVRVETEKKLTQAEVDAVMKFIKP